MADDVALIKSAMKLYNAGVDYDRTNREDIRSDLDFLAGNQWDEADIEQRKEEGRLYITENRLPAFVSQVVGDIRQQKPSIRVRGVDSQADPKLAETLTGLVRNIESGSSTRQPIINAANSAVSCGIGHFRILTDYLDSNSYDQDIFMEPIPDPLAVVWDPDSQMVTREDAMWCFVVTDMSRDAFISAYPNENTESFNDDEPVGENQWNDWSSKDAIKVAEFWQKEPAKVRLGRMSDGSVHALEDGDDETKYEEIRVRDTYKVTVTKISGVGVLEETRDWMTPHIPIVPVVGEEIQLEKGVQRRGVIRFAKDAQKRLNYWITAQTEWLALQPKSPFIATVDQIKGFEAKWALANKTNNGVLPYNSDPKAPGAPQRSQPPVGSTGFYNEVMQAADALKATTGIYDASLGNQSNETSGRAIRERKQQSATGTYTYTDNLARSIEYAGKIIVALIPKIYDTRRTVRILGEDGAESYETLNDDVVENGEPVKRNDLSVGQYDVTVTTGPSYSTRRAEAAESMIQFIQTMPDAAALTSDLIAKNMDWPGAEEFASRLEKTLPPGTIKPDEDDQEAIAAAQRAQMAAQQQEQMQVQDFSLEMKRKELEAVKIDAEIRKIGAEAQNTDAKTRETIAQAVLKELEAQMKSGAFNSVIQLALDAPSGAQYIAQ